MAYIRNYKKFSIPYGLKTHLLNKIRSEHPVKANCYEDYYSWRQELLGEFLGEEWVSKLLLKVSEALGRSVPREKVSVVVHFGFGDVEPHRDGLSKTCFLVPLRVPAKAKFYVEHESVEMSKCKLIRFSDYDMHGIENPGYGFFAVLSVTYDC